jgi:prepilin-type N-terminal cleavage/methylation domain-containing protein
MTARFTIIHKPHSTLARDFIATNGRITRRAFTLVEVLVVIAIIAVITAIAFPTYRTLIARADSAKSLSQMRSIGVAAITYSADNGMKLPTAFDWPDRGRIYEKPGWVAGTIGKDWSDDMWIWALVNRQNLPLEAFTSPQANKQLKALGYEPWPAFMLNQVPTLEETTTNKAFFSSLAKYSSPEKTILLSQVAFNSTTIAHRSWAHCNYWGDWGIMHAVENQKSGMKKSHYIFVDGHAETLAPEETVGAKTTRWFDPGMFPNSWWPNEAACASQLRRHLPKTN